jgi:hypothetical protein
MPINSERQRLAPLLERKSLRNPPFLSVGCTIAPCFYVGCTTVTEDETLRFFVAGVK